MVPPVAFEDNCVNTLLFNDMCLSTVQCFGKHDSELKLRVILLCARSTQQSKWNLH